MSSTAQQGTAPEEPWWNSDEDLPMVSGPEAQAHDSGMPEADQPPPGPSTANTAPVKGPSPEPEPEPEPQPEPQPGSGFTPTQGPDAAGSTAAAAPDVANSPRPALREAPGLKIRGVFVIMTAFATVGCVIGFVVSGTISIPSAAGWGLLLGSITAAVLSPPRLGWTAAWMPPLAITAVIAVMGQFTFLGSMPTLAREVAMLAANLTAMAPAQLLSVAAAAGILLLKRRLLST